MKRLFIFLAMIYATPACFAQNTTVIATVTDPNGQPYAFSTGYAGLVCPGGAAPTYNGYTVPRTFTITGFDGNGSFSQVVYDVNLIQPTGCGYQWHITYKDGVTNFITGTITDVTGPAIDESANISAYAVTLPLVPGQFYQTVEGNGTPASPQRPTLNLVPGTNVSSIGCADNSGAQRTDCTINTTGGTGALLGNDNTFTNNNRFQGPIPWRDFTAYMPAGGCASVNASDPNTTGTISSTSHTLTVSSAIDFKNGCGITVLHGGPTSTMIMPSSCTASVSQSGGVVTATCSGNHNLDVGVSQQGQDQSVVVTGCSDSGFNGTFGIQSIPTGLTLSWNSVHSGTATGCTVSFLNGWYRGATGSSTYYYKFAACDSGGGCSAAVGPVTIANSAMVVQSSPNYRNGYVGGTPYAVNDEVSYANELWLSLVNSNLGNQPDLSPTDWVILNENYNWVGWPVINNASGKARLVCVYRSTDNVTYAAVGTSATLGYTDRGLPFPVPAFCPSTPPASATAQQLTTTIASGAGTTTLTLAAAASNNATSQNVYHDETPFLATCVAAVNVDQVQAITSGSHGCLIPAGSYHFNSDWPTDTVASTSGVAIYVDGTIVLHTWPIIISAGYWSIQGMGFSGGSVPVQHFPTTKMAIGSHVPDVFVVHNYTDSIHGFALTGLYGNGVAASSDVGSDSAPSNFDLEDMTFSMTPFNGGGVPLVIDSNVLYMTGKNLNFQPAETGIPASILFTSSSYDGNTWCCMQFENIFTEWHGLLFEAPGGVNSGAGAGISFTHWESEEHGSYPTGGFVTLDAGYTGQVPAGVSAGPNLPGIAITQLDNADSSNKTLMYYKGTASAGIVGISLHSSDFFSTLVGCALYATTCAGGVAPNIQSDSKQNLAGISEKYIGLGAGSGSAGTYFIFNPLVVSGGYNDFYYNPPAPAFADALPAPVNISIGSTGSGSLSAGQYCMRIVLLDTQTTPGYTLPSPEICQVVGASSNIVVNWQTSQDGPAYSDAYLLYGSIPGGENMAIDTGITPSSLSGTYTFTSTSSAFSFTVPQVPTAYMSWLYRDTGKPSCLFCAKSSSTLWQLGIGESSVPSGDKLAVKGGLLDAEAGEVVSDGAGFGSNQLNQRAACETSFGATALSGASTTTGLTCLPANAVIDSIVYRVTTTITTAASFTLGDSGSATRYATCVFSGGSQSMTSGATGYCNDGFYQNGGTALGVKITPNTSPGAGALRIIVYYHIWTPPTS